MDESETPQPEGEANALVQRLRLIEDQPLESRAGAFSHVYDELQMRLEGGELPRVHA